MAHGQWMAMMLVCLASPASGQASPSATDVARAGRKQAEAVEEVGLFKSSYKHLTYEFIRYFRGQSMMGDGELWAWFQHDTNGELKRPLKLRFQGKTFNQKFGNVNITTIIDSETSLLHVNFDLADMDEHQCVSYPFTPRSNVEQQMEKLLARDQRELTELRRFNHAGGVGEFSFNWTEKKRFELKFTRQGFLNSATMTHNGRIVKKLAIQSIYLGEKIPDTDVSIFNQPGDCELFSEVHDPLARLKLHAPHHTSSLLSDMLTFISQAHIQKLVVSGILQYPTEEVRQLITLNALALPGDIAVMLEEPEAPNLAGHGTGIKYDYRATDFHKVNSSGTVWLNMTERAFRISGQTYNKVYGNVTVDFIARSNITLAKAMPSVAYMKNVYENPVIFSRIHMPNANIGGVVGLSSCAALSYPPRPHDSGMEIARSLGNHLRFLEVSEDRGEDCAIFVVRLEESFLLVYIDMEEEDHHAVMRVDIRNRSHLLRKTEVLRWYNEAADFHLELLPEIGWNCARTPKSTELEGIPAAFFNASKNHASVLMDTLYAVRRFPVGWAMLELMQVPGDLKIKLKVEDNSSSYIPGQAKKLHNFLGARYKHFRFEYVREEQGKSWSGMGELWAYFLSINGIIPAVKLRITWSPDAWRNKVVTIIIDTTEKVIYVARRGRSGRGGLKQSCIMFPPNLIEKVESLMPRSQQDEAYFSQLLAREVLNLHQLENYISGDQDGHRYQDGYVEYRLPWTKGYQITVSFDAQGRFVGMTTQGTSAKRMRVLGDIDEDSAPPSNLVGIWGAPDDNCQVQAEAPTDPTSFAISTPAFQNFLHVARLDAHRHVRGFLTLLACDIAGDSTVTKYEADARPMSVLSANFKTFKYNFERILQGIRFKGEGQFWAWFDSHNSLKLKFWGHTQNQKFGGIDITTIIDSTTKQIHMSFKLPELHVHECVIYPMVKRHRLLSQMTKLLRRDEDALTVLQDFDFTGEVTLNWTRSKKMTLRFSPLGTLERVAMLHNGRVMRNFTVVGEIQMSQTLPPSLDNIFHPPAACKLFNKIDHPLASLSQRSLDLAASAPHLRSSALSDILTMMTKMHDGKLPGILRDSTLFTLAAFALPGDIAVMLSDPKPPNLEGKGTGVKFDYKAETHKFGGVYTSNGSVWFNATERAFRLSGRARKTIYGTAHVDFIARAEPYEPGAKGALASTAYMKNVMHKVFEQPALFCNAAFSSDNKQQCVGYEYPQRPGREGYHGIGIHRSLARHLRFVEVAEARGEDVAIFMVELANSNFLFVWVDTELQDHHAIVRIDVRNSSHLLRKLEVTKWHNDALDFSQELLPPISWNCLFGDDKQGEIFQLTKDGPVATELIDTLYAVDQLPMGTALLELLALPGDLQLKLKQSDGSGAYMPAPAHRVINFLSAPYKHLRFGYERYWSGRDGNTSRWEGEGELWMWSQKHEGKDEVKVRFRAESKTERFGRVQITLVIDSAQRVMYANVKMDTMREEECTMYPLSGGLENPDRLVRFLEHDFVELRALEESFGAFKAGAAPTEDDELGTKLPSLMIDWTHRKKLRLVFNEQGYFTGMVTYQISRAFKLMRVIGPVDYGAEPPADFQDIFTAPASDCRVLDAIEDPLAQVVVNAPHHRSSALKDFLTIAISYPHEHARQLLTLLILSIPGDVPLLLEEPKPPNLADRHGIAFDYKATVLPGSPSQRSSSGAVWSSIDDRAFHLYGLSQRNIEFGRVQVDFIAHATTPEVVYANLQLENTNSVYVQQCIEYQYPTKPGSLPAHLVQDASQPLQFRGVQGIRGEDTSVFSAELPHGRTMFLWVDLEEEDHHSIMKVRVDNATATLRITEITKWKDHEDFSVQLSPMPEWHCSPDPGDQVDKTIAHFGLRRIRAKSKNLHDTLFAMQEMPPNFAMLELLSMPGDLSIEINAAPSSLAPGLQPGATLPPALGPAPTLEPIPGLPISQISGSHRNTFSVISLVLSLLTCLSVLVVQVVAAASAAGVQVPLLAVLPPASSALFCLQVARFAARSKDVHEAIDDLTQFFAWVLPIAPVKTLAWSIGVMILVSLLRLGASQRHHNEVIKSARRDPNIECVPHGVTFGAWELRALGFLAFPLAQVSIALLIDYEALPLVGPVISVALLIGMGYVMKNTITFVTDVIEEKDVIRTRLPRPAGGFDVFVDRACDQLRALPARPAQPACSVFFGGWLASPAWCTAPTVAAIHEVEHQGARAARDHELDMMEPVVTSSLLCSSTGVSAETDDHLEELRTVSGEARPLLRQNSEVRGHLPSDFDASGREEDTVGFSSTARDEELWDRASVVDCQHPMKVKTAYTYDINVGDLVAGVVCIPWLDCAVPAGALRRLEEVCGDINLQVHPGQLSGRLTSGRYAVCFDWGTNYPWRWPAETMLKAWIGIWFSLPISLDAFQGPLTLMIHIVVLCFVGTFAYGAYTIQPYAHPYDNVTLVASWVAVTLVIFVQSFGHTMTRVALLASFGIAGALIIICTVTLLAAVALVIVMLGRLEVQGLQDRLLPSTIDGWGPQSFTSRATDPTIFVSSDIGPLGCGMTPDSSGHANNAVEVILPGPRPAIAIVLPGMARPVVVHKQLLPSVAGRSADPDTLTSMGDRARLPLPINVLFDSPGKRQRGTVTPPIAALLAPGKPGCLVYSEAHQNGGVEWAQAVKDFFGETGAQLAEETLRLIELNIEENAGKGPQLVVVEVLPAFAAEFMDERHAALQE